MPHNRFLKSINLFSSVCHFSLCCEGLCSSTGLFWTTKKKSKTLIKSCKFFYDIKGKKKRRMSSRRIAEIFCCHRQHESHIDFSTEWDSILDDSFRNFLCLARCVFWAKQIGKKFIELSKVFLGKFDEVGGPAMAGIFDTEFEILSSGYFWSKPQFFWKIVVIVEYILRQMFCLLYAVKKPRVDT